jgi:hypothetical protein
MLPETGVEGFIAGLKTCGANPNLSDGLVHYEVEPVEGAMRGTVVVTAVEVAEVQRWPLVPPHWIHLPSEVRFSRTNSQGSSKPGWLKHSRQIAGWGADARPERAWLSHVRAIIGEAG